VSTVRQRVTQGEQLVSAADRLADIERRLAALEKARKPSPMQFSLPGNTPGLFTGVFVPSEGGQLVEIHAANAPQTPGSTPTTAQLWRNNALYIEFEYTGETSFAVVEDLRTGDQWQAVITEWGTDAADATIRGDIEPHSTLGHGDA
jgi:hypothetical protein